MGVLDQELPMPYIALRDYLIEHYKAKRASGGRECIIRCPFCGDSKNRNSAHLYVGINRKNKTISYNCFKCNSSGSVGRDFFQRLEIYDTSLINLVLNYNRNLGVDTSLSRSFTASYTQDYENTIIPVKNTPEYQKKLAYVNKRIGGHLTLYDIPRYKIILNLLDYLNFNGIKVHSRHPKIMEELAFGFVGFLSVDGSHVIMRRVVPEEKVHESLRKRYTNYTINEHGNTFYCIPEGINPNYHTDLCLAEGPFDALSIHYNLRAFQFNKIIMSTNGKEGLDNVIKYLVWKKGMSLFNTTAHIYLDNDVTNYDISVYTNLLMSIGLPFVFHRNTYPGEKDYGVPGDHIIDTV